MRSHEYQVAGREFLSLMFLPLAPLLIFVLLMRVGSSAGFLPAPLPIHDVDRTILLHQAVASRQSSGASIVFAGDSSCLMNVSAPVLEQSLGGGARVINLGTLSYLDPNDYTRLVHNYFAANPRSVRLVVLMMHPEALRLGAREPYFSEVLAAHREQRDVCEPSASEFLCWTGVNIFRGRILAHLVPEPLPGVYGIRYGFNRNLWSELAKHNGSAIDPRTYSPQGGSSEFRLSQTIEKFSRSFRSSWPEGVKLAVAVSPIPEALATPRYAEDCSALLRQWSGWLNADVLLTNLPCSFPDIDFANSAHLHENAVASYTERLAEELKTLGLRPD